MTPVPRWWAWWLRFNFWRIERGRRRGKGSRTLDDLDRLAFIGFAHWALADPPDTARGRGGGRPPAAYVLFQSNFNGAAREYIEGFARVITTGMRGLWWGAHGVPDPLPVSRFEDYILAARLPVDHYWCAYPGVSTKMLRAALELRREHDDFARRAAGLDPEAFAAEYERFVTRVQHLI
jgi:hypothetical protein